MHPTERATWEILVSENAFAERSFQLSEGSLRVGTSPICEVIATSPGVAPRHAEFVAAPEMLQLRAFEENPPVLLNGAHVRGLVNVPCPATVQIGSLKISVKQAAANGPSKTNPDSTLRLVHPARPEFAPLTDPENLDVTGRIVYRLPGTEDTVALRTASSRTKDTPLQSTAFSGDVTMAFSMEELEISISDKVPVRMDYEVKDEIARGGMGRIFSAEDISLERHVALKVSTVGDPARTPQFFREAKILAALAHPNIVPIHSVGVDSGGRPFYSMKLIQGRTLQRIIKLLASGDRETAEAYPSMRLLDIFRKVCDAVSFAHSRGYLHRDLKPDNIMVGEFGEVLVMDWGLAKTIRRPGEDTAGQGTEEDEPETLPYIEGTPQYMSPEQANGVYGGLDERSDIYSLGGILYAILTLRPPVSGSSLNEVLEKVRKGETTTMAMPRGEVSSATPQRDALRVPDALRAVTFKALAKDRDRRYRSVAELARDIEAYIGGFATEAEGAGLGRHMVLLVRRNRLASALAGIAMTGALIFTAQLAESEKNAQASADLAKQEAARATANADEAKRNAARAEAEARIAAKNEQQAKQEKEESRKAQARTQIALAEAAEQAQNAAAMQKALDGVPEDLQHQEWRYLSGLTNSAEVTIENKTPSRWHKFEPHPKDPDLLFTLHEDGAIRTVNLKTGIQEMVVHTGRGHPQTSRLAISPDAKLAAVCGLNANSTLTEVDLFDLETKTKKGGFKFPYPESRGIPYFQFDSKSTVLLCSLTRPAQVYLYDVGKSALRWDPWTHPDKKGGIASLSHHERSVLVRLVGSEELVEISVVDGVQKNEQPKEKFKPGVAAAEFYTYTPSAGRVFSSLNGVLVGFEPQSGKRLFAERLPSLSGLPGTKAQSNLAYISDPELAVTLNPVSDGAAALLIHDTTDGRAIQTRLVQMQKSLHLDWQLTTHPLSKKIAVVRGDTIKVWSLPRNGHKTQFAVWSNSVFDGFSFVHGNAKIVTTLKSGIHSERTAAELEVRTLETSPESRSMQLLPLEQPFVTHPAVYTTASRDGKWLGAKFQQDATFVIWGVEEGVMSAPRSFKPGGSFWDLKFSPSGRMLWTSNGAIEVASEQLISKLDRAGLWRPAELISPVWMGESRVAEIQMLQKDKTNLTWNADRTIVSWEVKTGLRAVTSQATDALCLAASPDGTQLAEGGADLRVRIRDAETLAVLKTLRVHDGPVEDMAWHPKLPLLATASSDYSIRIWDLRTEQMREEFRYIRNIQPMRVKWSPDGKYLAVSDSGGTPNVKVYEPEACKETDRPKR